MSTQVDAQFIQRRAALMAELFLEELRPTFAAQAELKNVPYDYLVGFSSASDGIKTYAIDLKATEDLREPRFPLRGSVAKLLVSSNIPAILLVADVKQNRLYYASSDEICRALEAGDGRDDVLVSLTPLDEAGRERLLHEVAA